jgi:hypothetical protein
MPREKKYPANSPNFFKKKKKNARKQKMQYGNDSICKARSNLWILNDANTEKQSLDLFFLSSPTNTCTILSREIRDKTKNKGS